MEGVQRIIRAQINRDGRRSLRSVNPNLIFFLKKTMPQNSN